MTFRIHRSTSSNTVIFALSGDLDQDHMTRLQEYLASETSERIALDLGDVVLVDRAAVDLLANATAAGVQLLNCPDYLRRWVATELDYRRQCAQGADDQERRWHDA
jgi:ABC-type transporter Mla MlaB component